MDPITLLLGAATRFAPEIIHWFTAKQEAAAEAARRKDQNAHELEMYDRQARHETELLQLHLKETAIQDEAAFRHDAVAAQGPLVATGSMFLNVVNGINALFRPAVSFWLFGIFALIRSAELTFVVVAAVRESWVTNAPGAWFAVFGASISALQKVWTPDDANLLAAIIGYWFLDRTIKHLRES